MIQTMSDKRQPGVIGSLPSTRPHRRSDKRGAVGPTEVTPPTPSAPAARATPAAKRKPAVKAKDAAAAKPARAKPSAARNQAAERSRTRAASPARDSEPPAPTSPGALQTALEATAELTEIGLRASARALRVALSRLPKP